MNAQARDSIKAATTADLAHVSKVLYNEILADVATLNGKGNTATAGKLEMMQRASDELYKRGLRQHKDGSWSEPRNECGPTAVCVETVNGHSIKLSFAINFF